MARRIEVEIIGDTRGLSKSFKQASGDAGAFGRSMSSAGRGLMNVGKAAGFVIGAAALGGLAVTLRAGIGEWKQSAEVQAQVEAGLKSTGGQANVTSGQIDKLATSIMSKSGIDDEAVKSGEAMLLTFTNIRNETGKNNDIFDQTTQALTDMAFRMSNGAAPSAEQMSSSAIRLGKAMNDPVKGITALTRVGVMFTAAQKTQIKTMMAAGDTMGAQKIILAELTKEFGGSAEMAGKTVPGQLNILKESFSNLAGEMVGAVAPAFVTVLGGVTNLMAKFNEADGASAKLGVLWDGVKQGASTVGAGIKEAFNAINWGAVGDTLKAGLQKAGDKLAAIDWSGHVAAVLKSIGDFLERAPIGPIAESISRAVGRGATAAAGAIRQQDFQKLGDQVTTSIGRAIAGADVSAITTGLIKLLAAVGFAGTALVVGVAGALGRAFTAGMWAGIQGSARIIAGTGPFLANLIISGFRSAGQWLVGPGVEIATGLWNGLKSGLGKVWALISSIPGQIQGAFSGASGWLFSAGSAAIGGFISGILSRLGDLKSTLTSIPGKVVGWKGPPSFDRKMLFVSGQLTLDGYIDGIKSRMGDLRTTLGGVTSSMRKLQSEIDAIQKRREDISNQAAVRSAIAALNAANAEKDTVKTKAADILAAEQQLAQVRETIHTTALSRELAQQQAMQDQLQAQFDKAQTKLQAAQDKAKAAHQKWLDAMQANIEKASAKAGTAFDAMAAKIQQAFQASSDSFVAPAQKLIDAITGRRAQEDMQQSVTDAQQALADAFEGGDSGAILEAQRNLARAQEDIRIAAYQVQAANQQTAHDQQVAAQQETLDRLLAGWRKKFVDQGVETGKGMQGILDIITGFVGGFSKAGDTLGDAFAKSLKAAIRSAVADAEAVSQAQIAAKTSPLPPGSFKLPMLQEGGIILGTGAAIVHRGETVVPANARTSSGHTFNITVNGLVGGATDVASTIVNEINRQQRVGRLRFAT